MSPVSVSLATENELVTDAARYLWLAQDAVRTRHGDQFRAFERRLDALADGYPNIGVSFLGANEKGALTFIVTPPQAWIDALAEARALGLI